MLTATVDKIVTKKWFFFKTVKAYSLNIFSDNGGSTWMNINSGEIVDSSMYYLYKAYKARRSLLEYKILS